MPEARSQKPEVGTQYPVPRPQPPLLPWRAGPATAILSGMIANQSTERWRPVKGYEGKYEVSDRGRVKSLGHYRYSDAGILKPFFHKFGYPRVTLWANGVSHGRAIHTLVLEAFVGPRPAPCVCDHRDGSPANNHLQNLQWVTQKENVRRGQQSAAIRGVGNCNAKLTEKIVLHIRNSWADGRETQRSMARRYGVTPSLISAVVRRRIWTHV